MNNNLSWQITLNSSMDIKQIKLSFIAVIIIFTTEYNTIPQTYCVLCVYNFDSLASLEENFNLSGLFYMNKMKT